MPQKELKFVVKSDLREGQGLEKFLNTLASTGNKVAKSFQNIGAQSTAGKQGALAKALQADKKLFDDLGVSADKLSKILNTQVAQSTDKLARSLRETNQRLKESVDTYEKWEKRVDAARRSGVDGKKMAALERLRDTAYENMLTHASDKSSFQSELGALKGEKGGLLKNLGGMSSELMGALGLGRVAGAAGPFAALAGAYWLMQKGFGKAEQFNMAAYEAPGRSASVSEDLYGRAAGLDFGTGYALNRMDMDGVSAGRVKNAQFWRGMSGGASWLVNPFHWFDDSKMSEHIQASMDEAYSDAINDISKNAGPKKLIAQNLMANAGEYTRQMRRFGGGGFDGIYNPSAMMLQEAIEQGSGYGLMPQESLALMNALGDRGGALLGGVPETRAAVMDAIRGGISMPTAAGLVGAAGGNAGMLGLLAGATDDNFVREKLGQAVLGVLDPGGLRLDNLGQGYMGMLSTGFAGQFAPEQNRILAQNVAGAQSMGALFGGHDAYQKSRNLVTAIGALRGTEAGSNIYAQNALAHLGDNPQVLADIVAKNGVVPAELRNMGLSKGVIEKYANATANSWVDRWYDTKGSDASSNAMREIQGAYKGDVRKWLMKDGEKGLNANVSLIAGLMPELTNGAIRDAAQGSGFLRGIAGLGGEGKLGEFKDGAGGTAELEVLKVQARTAAQALGRLHGAVTPFTDEIIKSLQALQAKRWEIEFLAGRAGVP